MSEREDHVTEEDLKLAEELQETIRKLNSALTFAASIGFSSEVEVKRGSLDGVQTAQVRLSVWRTISLL